MEGYCKLDQIHQLTPAEIDALEKECFPYEAGQDEYGCETVRQLIAAIRARDAKILDLENSLIVATDALYKED